jgi:TPR repeat protein
MIEARANLRRGALGLFALMAMAEAPQVTAPKTPAPSASGKSAPAPLPADLQAALKAADAGQPADLLRLAEGGRADAEYYAAVMLVFGRAKVAKDPARGCAYAQKASVTRADAMHLVGECRRSGLAGKPDLEGAKAAYTRAAEMGFLRSKCALGDMLLVEPGGAARGLALCREAAEAGDVAAQVRLAELYRKGGLVKADRGEARRWYQKAAERNHAESARKLGEMYASGEGGKRDRKKAVALWQQAEKAGDPMAPILVADQLFSDMTGGKQPVPGKFGFKGGVPVEDLKIVEQWYREAQTRDPRPEVRKRAEMALYVLKSFQSAGQAVTVKK